MLFGLVCQNVFGTECIIYKKLWMNEAKVYNKMVDYSPSPKEK